MIYYKLYLLEGCFHVSITKKNLKLGWEVRLFFFGLHKKEKVLLQKNKKIFGVGNIFKQERQSIQYLVQSVTDFTIIINHLEKFTLKTKINKIINYENR